MKQILILGGGFAGTSTALGLEKKLKDNNDVAITLVDEEPYHLFHANLYEVATSPEELTSIGQLKKSVALPFKEIFEGKKINFVQGKASQINLQQQTVSVNGRDLKYDNLLLALGATNNFYGIEGAEEFSYTLQSVNGALRIRNRLQFLAQMHRSDITKNTIRIAIAGGGFAGVEVAAEMKGFLDFLAWENGFPREKFETLIIEGAGHVVPGMDDQVVTDVSGRLQELGVRMQTGSMISKVDAHFLEFKNGERLSYDCLIWTAGVKANTIPVTPEMETDRGGRVLVNNKLQFEKYPNVFVLGDKACIMDQSGHPVPGTAMQAIDQAKYLSDAVCEVVCNKHCENYTTKVTPFFIPLGGKWMIFKYKHLYITGYLAYILRQIVFFRYFKSLLGFTRALKLLILGIELYGMNDD